MDMEIFLQKGRRMNSEHSLILSWQIDSPLDVSAFPWTQSVPFHLVLAVKATQSLHLIHHELTCHWVFLNKTEILDALSS